MAKRSKKKHTTVLVLWGNRETTHRGATLEQALKVAERSRLPTGCSVKWSKLQKLSTVAGGEGPVRCDRPRHIEGETMRFVAMRKRGHKLRASGYKKRRV